jgi:hypothetical protein
MDGRNLRQYAAGVAHHRHAWNARPRRVPLIARNWHRWQARGKSTGSWKSSARVTVHRMH